MSTELISSLLENLEPQKVITADEVLIARRQDYWNASNIINLSDAPVARPSVVVQPTNVEDVQRIVSICNARSTPIIPYGLGSGVCGGVQSQGNEVLLDLGKMNRLRSIDSENMIASFDAGKRGIEAERDVSKSGFTIGHWPQSIELSSVGGWVATRASGQFSTAYGNIEDIVYSIEAVMPNGEIANFGKAPRASAGPDLRHVLLGSEGTLGIITGVSLSLRKTAPKKVGSIFLANDLKEAIDAQRRIIQANWRPPVVRQYDASESARHFGDLIPDGACVLLLVHEGDPEIIDIEKARCEDIAVTSGLAVGESSIVEHWLKNRNSVGSFTEYLERNLVVDTIEVGATWSNLQAIYDRVTNAMMQVPGMLSATGHSSHAYRSGANLYFTFVGRMEGVQEQADFYFKAWDAAMEATIAEGGSIAHHHGIGRVRKKYLSNDIGESGVATLRAIKRALDENGIMNPGVLLPDE